MTPDEREEIARLIEADIPKAKRDAKDLERVREINRRAEERAHEHQD